MKKKKPDLYGDIINALIELKQKYPSYSMGKHISTALDDYGEIWGLSDKEILYAFTKYRATLEMDVPHETDEDEIQQIIEDGLNLTTLSYNEESYTDDEYNI